MSQFCTRLYPLDELRSEVIFAPFHDPLLAPTLPIRLHSQDGKNCRYSHVWDATHIFWDSCSKEGLACSLQLDVSLPQHPYNQLIFCVTIAENTSLDFQAYLDGTWQRLSPTLSGTNSRQEITCAIPAGELQAVRVDCHSLNGQRAVVRVHWFGLADSTVAHLGRSRRPWHDVEWDGLLTGEQDLTDRKFLLALLFDANDLNALRDKKTRPYWREHFSVLEQRANTYLERQPEDDLGLYLPWLDERYVRAHERGRESYFWQPLTLAVVGHVNSDARMLRHAARYLMCMVHTVHWCQSAESRANGSTWNQRCFLEEMASTSVALLFDWLNFMLTDQARALICQTLWEKGLAAIERDMMRCEEVHRINQGVWFCRGRILAGLVLEQSWPHVGKYVDRAAHDLARIFNGYIKPDGGVEEGMGYFCLTLSFALQGLIAYARVRRLDIEQLLPEHIRSAEHFLSTMSAVEPGRLLMDGDNSTDRMPFDAIALLAGVFPNSTYSRVLAATLLPDERPFTYFDHYDPGGVFAFLLGPMDVSPPQTVVPEFRNLPYVGQLTSLRTNGKTSLRVHLSGACANPSHSHFDRGAFTVEADGQPVFIDRGIVRYDHPACFILKQTGLHNTLTPVLSDGSFPDQGSCEQPVLPQGSGDSEMLHAAIDVSHVWREHMLHYRRTMHSHNCNEFTVGDEGELLTPGRVAFHLHSPAPFENTGSPGEWELTMDTIQFRIRADWCSESRCTRDSIDYRMQPVFHLVLISDVLTSFQLHTHFTRIRTH